MVLAVPSIKVADLSKKSKGTYRACSGKGVEFFDKEWWADAAAILSRKLPKSVVVRGEEVRQNIGGGRVKRLVVKEWIINKAFLGNRVDDYRKWNVMKYIGDKGVCLLYCLYHQKMTLQALDIIEEAEPHILHIPGE
ncbi:MAG: hypothetical protein KOO63_05385 [Bacteroidales bacterium]|nr:hypothetical protein [Candidatus Latescibacterota bacterium]